MVIASPGHNLFAIDYSAVELRTLAAVCLQRYGKSKLAEIIAEGVDPHKYTAALLLKMTLQEFEQLPAVTQKEHRQRAKAINFGIPGGLGPVTLVDYAQQTYDVDMSKSEAKRFRDRLIYEVYPELWRYLEGESGKVITLTGRVRAGTTYTQEKNTPFQGLAADGAKLALWQLVKQGYRVIAFIHDEFLIELPEDCDQTQTAKEIEDICCRAMQDLTSTIPIRCEYALMRNWSKKAEEVRDSEGRLMVWHADDAP